MANFDIVSLSQSAYHSSSLSHSLSLSLFLSLSHTFLSYLSLDPSPSASPFSFLIVCDSRRLPLQFVCKVSYYHVACGMWHVARCVLVLSGWAWHKHTFLNLCKKPHTHTKCKWPATIGADIVAASAVAVAAAPISCTLRSRRLVWGTT